MRDFIDYVYWNARYLVSRPNFCYLATGEQLSYGGVCEKLRNSYYLYKVESGKGKVNYYLTQFCFTALKIKGQDNLSKFARSKYAEMEAKLAQITEKLNSNARLPMFDDVTRLEYIAEQITLATKLGFSYRTQYNLLGVCKQVFRLTSAEIRLFDTVLDLYAIKLFCVAVEKISTNPTLAQELLCNIFKVSQNAEHLPYDTAHTHAKTHSKNLCAIISANGNSQLTHLGQTVTYAPKGDAETGLTLTVAEKINLFCTFSQHRFTDKLFLFRSMSNGLQIDLKLYYKGNNEVRKYTFANNYKKSRNLTLNFSVYPYCGNGAYDFLCVGEACCVKMSNNGRTTYYCVTVLGCATTPRFCSNSYSSCLQMQCTAQISPKSTRTVTVVTTFATDFTELTSTLKSVNALSFLSYPLLFCDKPILADISTHNSTQENLSQPQTDTTLPNTEHSTVQVLIPNTTLHKTPTQAKTKRLIFTNMEYARELSPPIVPYTNLVRFGDKFSFTLGSRGENSTLYKGYLTFMGENVHIVYGKKVICLTDSFPTQHGAFLRYAYADTEIEVSLDLSFSRKKQFSITCKTAKKCKVYAVFTFDFTSPRLFNVMACDNMEKQTANDNLPTPISNATENNSLAPYISSAPLTFSQPADKDTATVQSTAQSTGKHATKQQPQLSKNIAKQQPLTQFISADNLFNISVDQPCYYTVNRADYVARAFELSLYRIENSKNRPLQNPLANSDFLAFACPVETCATATIWSKAPSYSHEYIVDDCLLAQKLNYCADKNLYLLDNLLAPATATTLASTVFANPSFLRSYLNSCLNNGYLTNKLTPYYTQTGALTYQKQPFAFTLAVIYYTNYTGDKSLLNVAEVATFVRTQLLSQVNGDYEKIIQLLCLKKSFCLFPDNLPFVRKYEQQRTTLTKTQQDLALFFGAIQNNALTEAKLSALYQNFSATSDKTWYYISQIENLYGVTMQKGCLSFAPASAPNTKLTLNLCGKTFDVTYRTGKPRTILNGAVIYSSFYPATLPKKDNTIQIFS